MNRSCKFCKWREDKQNFIGKIIWCGAKTEETTLEEYCTNYQQLSKEKITLN